MLDKLEAPKGANKNRKRLGRGEASGVGKTAGKGHKGQNARSGGGVKAGFEGGQMPLQRRIPKRGFTNIFKKQFETVNISVLEVKFAAGETVTKEALKEKGVIKSAKKALKILGDGELKASLTVQANQFSTSAKAKIEAAGGKAEVL